MVIITTHQFQAHAQSQELHLALLFAFSGHPMLLYPINYHRYRLYAARWFPYLSMVILLSWWYSFSHGETHRVRSWSFFIKIWRQLRSFIVIRECSRYKDYPGKEVRHVRCGTKRDPPNVHSSFPLTFGWAFSWTSACAGLVAQKADRLPTLIICRLTTAEYIVRVVYSTSVNMPFELRGWVNTRGSLWYFNGAYKVFKTGLSWCQPCNPQQADRSHPIIPKIIQPIFGVSMPFSKLHECALVGCEVQSVEVAICRSYTMVPQHQQCRVTILEI